jgi:hypothetical protein
MCWKRVMASKTQNHSENKICGKQDLLIK